MLMPTGLGQAFCTMDAKQCPDGSFTGRVPPDCRFAPCPGERVPGGGWMQPGGGGLLPPGYLGPPIAVPRGFPGQEPGGDGVPLYRYPEDPQQVGVMPNLPPLGPVKWIGENLGTVLLVAGGVAVALFFLGARKGRY